MQKKVKDEVKQELTLEQYQEIVKVLTKEIKGVLCGENDLTKVGALDALVMCLGDLIAISISCETRPNLVVKDRSEKCVGYVASRASEAYEQKYGDTLFGLETNKK